MKTNLLLVLFFSSQWAFSHGFHSGSQFKRTQESLSVTVKDIGGAIAVKRDYPLRYADCEKVYDPDEATCFVEMAKSAPMHMDHVFPIDPVSPSPEHEVSIGANGLGYFINYYGPSQSKTEQLKQIKEALILFQKKGITKIRVQAYRPAFRKSGGENFQETVLGPIVGVHRKVAVRFQDCAKALQGNVCWISIVKEAVPDHPGPTGGGEAVEKVHHFSPTESVIVTLENLYSDVVVRYDGPETTQTKILEKIRAALDILKGPDAELYLSCEMFTLKKNRELQVMGAPFVDTEVSGAVFFEVGMPLDFHQCESTLNTAFQSCEATFPGQIPMGNLDHTGGDTFKGVQLENQGSLSIYGTYVTGNPFWRLNYALAPNSVLTPLELVKKGFDTLAEAADATIKAYGFRSTATE